MGQKIPDVKNGDAVAADGDRISPDREIDRREFLDEPDVSVLLAAEIAQDIIIGEIDLFRDAGLRLWVSNGVHPLSFNIDPTALIKSGASKCGFNPDDLAEVCRNILINLIVSDDQNDRPVRGKIP